MRGEEVSGGARILAAAPACLEFAMLVEDAHPPAWGVGGGSHRAGPHPRLEAQLGDIDIALAVDKDLARTDDIGPGGKELTLRREELDAAVLAVSDEHGSFRVHCDPVGNVELAGTTPWFAPGEEQPAVGGELVHSGVAVAISDV